MALLRSKTENLPEGAVILSEKEAFTYQWKLLESWPNASDTRPVKLGPCLLSAASFFTGAYFNSHYRAKFKLFQHGRIASYLPVAVVPAALTLLTHTEFVLRDLVLSKSNVCPLCIQIRSSSLQLTSGFILPLLISQMGCASLAVRFATYNVPHPLYEPKKTLEVLAKMTRPVKNILFAIFVGQILLAATVVQFEAKSIFKVNQQMIKWEKEQEELIN